MFNVPSWKRIALVLGVVSAVALVAVGGLALAAGGSPSLECSACPDRFTVEHVSTGQYRVIVPAKTFTHAGSLPVPVITAFNGTTSAAG